MMTITRLLRHCLSPLVACFVGLSATATAGNAFSAATLLTGSAPSSIINNAAFTKEADDPPEFHKTVWWKWKAPATGRVTVDISGGGNFNKAILFAISPVDNPAGISSLAAIDATAALSGSFPVTAGTMYYFCGGSLTDSAGGNFRIALSLNANSDISALNFQHPASFANDNFASRIALTGAHVSAMGYSANATNEAGSLEPDNGYRTLWWSWRAPAAGRVRITMLGSNFLAPVMSVFSGTDFGSLKYVAKAVSSNNFSQVYATASFPVSAGSLYQISMGHYYSNLYGSVVLSVDLDTDTPLASLNLPVPSAVTNDNFADQLALSGSDISSISYSPSATVQAGSVEPTNGYRTLWWNWTAPATGMLNLATDESDNFRKVVSVFSGDSLNSLKWIYKGFDTLNVPVVKGQIYRISVGSDRSQDGGSVVLTCRLNDTVAPAGLNVAGQGSTSNDTFGNRITVKGGDISMIAYPYSATRDVGEPEDTGSGTVWWSWTSPGNGQVSLGLNGPKEEYRWISVWTGSSVAALTKVARSAYVNDTDPTVSFTAQAGVTYHIALGLTRLSSGPNSPTILTLVAPFVVPDVPLKMVIRGSPRAPKLGLTGPAGGVVQVQMSTDLKTWTSLQQVTLTGGAAEITPPAPSSARRQRYFRAVLP